MPLHAVTYRSRLLGLLFSSSASILTICLDFLLRKTLIVLTKKEGQDTQTEFEQSVFFKLSFAFIFNSALVPLAAGIFMSWVAGGYGVDQSWYENRGVVYQALVLILINVLKEFTKAIPPRTVFSRYVQGQFVYSQAKLDELWQPPKMHTGVLYAETVKLAALGVLAASLRFAPSLAASHRFSPLLYASHRLSPLLTASRRFSTLLTASRRLSPCLR